MRPERHVSDTLLPVAIQSTTSEQALENEIQEYMQVR